MELFATMVSEENDPDVAAILFMAIFPYLQLDETPNRNGCLFLDSLSCLYPILVIMLSLFHLRDQVRSVDDLLISMPACYD